MTVGPIQPLPLIMTTDEVAGILRCKPSTVENYIHEHALRAVLIGRERRITGDDLIEFIATRPDTTRGGK